MPAAQCEASSRILIDRALEFRGWNLLDPHEVRFELHTVTGQADYVLAVVEQAKPQFHGTVMKRLTKGTLEDATLLFPLLPAQTQFAARVTEIGAIESAQAASHCRHGDLFQSLLYEAFNGEL